MDKNSVIEALQVLEQANSNPKGYSAGEILSVLNIEATRENKKQVRKILRSLISHRSHPEFATAGNDNIVYSPGGKGSGTYRLTVYKGQ